MELWSLFIVGSLVWLNIFLQALYTDVTSGVKYALSNRTEAPPRATEFGRRLERALRNQVEGAAAWTALVLFAVLTDSTNVVTYWAAVAVSVSRVFYLPAYALGLTPFRSFVWAGFFMGAPVFAVAAVLN